MFCPLNVRSAYSLLYGVNRIEEILDRAQELGYDRIALTDVNNLYGVHAFVEAARARRIKPIVGAELTGKDGRVVALVQTREGFSNLCQFLTEQKRATRFNFVSALLRLSTGLTLITDAPVLLETFVGRVPHLFAGLSNQSTSVVPIAQTLGVPLVVLGTSTFLYEEDYRTHRVLRACALGKTIGSLVPSDLAPADSIFPTPSQIQKRFRTWPKAIETTQTVAAMCQFDGFDGKAVFPAYPTSGEKSVYDLLRDRALEGASARYGELSEAVLDRLEYELKTIETKGFSDYFLVVADIVKKTSRTCGRGSGAASLVSYCLGITNVDPIAHNLYFERFLNPARLDPPDMDIDFAWDERDDIIESVIEQFGADRCARVANHNFFRPKAALRETARAYGIPDGEISQKEHRIFHWGDETAKLEPPWPEILEIAKKLDGLPRGMGMHCGGLVITPGPICRYAPIEKSAEGYPLLAWEKEGTEAAGLVKIDLLGNRSLAVIRDCLANLREQGVEIDPARWKPADDLATQTALAQAQTMGVFYIESPAMRQLQRKAKVGDFPHIVIHSSLIRPAAATYINEYVQRLGGKPYQPLHPRLDKLLDETFGILCYQEDVSKTAIALADFSEYEADQLRKALSKSFGDAKLAQYKNQFYSGCARNGVATETVDQIWGMILSFSGYSFCKPHSASYAMVSFQSAWLRVHHPAAFIAAVLSNQGGYYTAQAYVSEARRMGVQLVGPDVNRSRKRYFAEGNVVVVGFMAIAGLNQTTVEAVLNARETAGPFRNADDFARRVGLVKADVLTLVSAGAFDALFAGSDRHEQTRLLLARVHAPPKGVSGQSALDFVAETPPVTYPEAPRRVSETSDELLQNELKTLGFLRNQHPLSLWRRSIARVKHVSSLEIPGRMGKSITLIGWPITQKEVLTAQGKPMEFVSFEDEDNIYETVLFPDAYRKFRMLLFEKCPFIVSGTVEEDLGAAYVNVRNLIKVARP